MTCSREVWFENTENWARRLVLQMVGIGPSGNRTHRRIVLGTAEQLRDIASARQMTSGLVQEINASDIRMTGEFMTLAQLADHFHQREVGRSNTRIAYSAKRVYQGYLGKWIVRRWGDYLLPNIKAV